MLSLYSCRFRAYMRWVYTYEISLMDPEIADVLLDAPYWILYIYGE